MSTIIRIIVDTMKHSDMEILIEEYREEEREKRNRALRARLARPCSQEELLARLGAIAPRQQRTNNNRILLTKFSGLFIMETAR